MGIGELHMGCKQTIRSLFPLEGGGGHSQVSCMGPTAARIAASVGHLSNSTGCPDATWPTYGHLAIPPHAMPQKI